MFRSRHIRIALVGLVLLMSLISRAESTDDFKFSDCVTNCIKPSSCPPSKFGRLDGKCMCKAARDDFLESVLGCMNIYCKPDLRDFDDKFLDPMQDGCEDINREIPEAKIKAAESIAKSFLSSLPATTTATASPGKTTLRTSIKATTTTATTTSSSATVAEPASSSSVIETTSTPPTQGVSSTTASPTPTTSASRGSNFVDTSPFSNPRSSGARSHFFMSLLGLPLAVVAFFYLGMIE